MVEAAVSKPEKPSVPISRELRVANYLTGVREFLEGSFKADSLEWKISASRFGILAPALHLSQSLAAYLERKFREDGVVSYESRSRTDRGGIAFRYSLDEVLAFAAICWVINEKRNGDGSLDDSLRSIVESTRGLLVGKNDRLNQHIIQSDEVPNSARIEIGKSKTLMTPRSDGKNGSSPDGATARPVELKSLTLERLRGLGETLLPTVDTVSLSRIRKEMGITPDQVEAMIGMANRLEIFKRVVDQEQLSCFGLKNIVEALIRLMDKNGANNLEELRNRLNNNQYVFLRAARNGSA